WPTGSSTTPSTVPTGPPPTAGTPWPRAWPRPAGTAPTSTGAAGCGWRSTTTGPRRSTTPGPRWPSTPACASTSRCSPPWASTRSRWPASRPSSGVTSRAGSGRSPTRWPRRSSCSERPTNAASGWRRCGTWPTPSASSPRSAASLRRKSCSTSAGSPRPSTRNGRADRVRVAVLCERLGAARFLDGLRRVPGLDLTCIVNTADDLDYAGVHVSPVVDTDEGRLGFQDYLVARRAEPAVRGVEHDGLAGARPAPAVLPALRGADLVILAPSSPLASLAPILALPGVRPALAAVPVTAVTPVVSGRAPA